MRVVATDNFTTYYNGVVTDVAEGQELSGDIAVYLLEGGSAVEPVGEAPASDSGQKDPGGPDTGGQQQGSGPDGSSQDGGPDVSGSIQEILAWVDGDPDKAQAVVAVESAKDKPRSTLLAKLAEITGD